MDKPVCPVIGFGPFALEPTRRGLRAGLTLAGLPD